MVNIKQNNFRKSNMRIGTNYENKCARVKNDDQFSRVGTDVIQG